MNALLKTTYKGFRIFDVDASDSPYRIGYSQNAYSAERGEYGTDGFVELNGINLRGTLGIKDLIDEYVHEERGE